MRKPRAVDGMQQQRLFATPHRGAEPTLEREDDEGFYGDEVAGTSLLQRNVQYFVQQCHLEKTFVEQVRHNTEYEAPPELQGLVGVLPRRCHARLV
jgi:hypothetical protein